MLRRLFNYSRELLLGKRGGGEKEKTTVVQPPAPPPIERTAADIQREQATAMRGAFETGKELYPEQYSLYQAFMPQLQQQLESPQFMAPQELEAQQAIRGREQERLRTGILTAANIGGGLYGGRTERRVERGMGELAQAYSQSDIQNRLARQQMLYGAISPYAQQVPQMGQQGVVDPNQIYNAYVQRMMAQTPEVFYQPGGGGGFNPAGMAGGAAGGAMMGSSLGPWGTAGGAVVGGALGAFS